LDFIMKHMAGVMLGKLQAAATKIARNPRANVHAKRMRAESKFYKDWLLVKFEAFCREKGWEMPQVTVFDFEDESRFPRIGAAGRDGHRTRAMTGGSPNAFLENLAAIMNSSSAMMHEQEPTEDEVSELSSHSGMTSSVWRNNAIVQYLREMEQRTEAKKAAKVAEARRRAAERLKPKELSFEKQERLQELKTARRRQLGVDEDDCAITTSSDVESPSNALSACGSHSSTRMVLSLECWLSQPF
jgi:predicted DNA-binding protein